MKLLTQAPAADVHTLVIPNDATDADMAAIKSKIGTAQVVELQFPQFTDGRAYSQAVLLRRRLGFNGTLRATGEVLIDQLAQMQRVGFDEAVLRADQNLVLAEQQMQQFSAYYQGDAANPLPHFRREGLAV